MARAWHLKSRPTGMPTPDNFELNELDLPPLGEGQVRVRNLWLSVDPYMRGRMNDVKSYVPPFQVGEPLEGGAIGEVVESKADGLAPGNLVQHMAGWRDEAVVDARIAQKLPDLGAPPERFLGVLGVTGMTAYFGLLDAGRAREGDIVFVSAGAGAVGSVVVQIARAKGMKVIASAGGAEKCEFVRSLGADQVIDYTAQKFEDVAKNVDLVLNTANAETTARSVAIVRPGGVLVTIVGGTDDAACTAARIRCAKPDRTTGTSNAELLARVVELADAGRFKVFVDGVYPMARAGEAWEKSRDGHTRGKLIIQVTPGPTMRHQ